jgi:hypothetical protein
MGLQPIRFLAIAVLFQLLIGCVPLTQERIVGGHTYDHFGYSQDERCGLLQVGPSNRRRTATIIPERSYATSPDGIRFGIATRLHPYDLTAGHTYVRERVYLLDKGGHQINRKWKDGQWIFHFALRTPHGEDTRDFHADLWTFYYNPIIHGPPN